MKSVCFAFLHILLVAPLQTIQQSQADYWFHEAREHFAKQEWDSARSSALKAVESNPQFADAEVLLGLIASLQGQSIAAQKHLERAVQLRPTDYQAQSYLAGAYLQQKKLVEAESGYKRVLKLNPGNATAYYNLGLIGMLRNQPADALQQFTRVLRSRPNDAPALLGLLETQLLLNRTAQARESATRLEGLLTPQDPRLFQAATLLALHEEYAVAIPLLERAKINPAASADVSYNLALAYFRTGQLDKASETLQSPRAETAESLNLLGQIEEQRRQPELALQAYGRAAKLSPQDEQIRFDFANQMLQHGSISKAMDQFQQGCQDFPQSWKMRVGLGACQYLSGRHETAAQSLLEAIRLEDSQVAYFLLGKIYEQAGPLQDPIQEAFEHYLQKPRSDAWAYFHLGTILFLRAQSQTPPDLEPAALQIRKALVLMPDFPEASLQLGVILQAQGRTEDSIRILEQLVKESPGLATAHYRLAQAYQKAKLSDKAKGEFAAYEKSRTQPQADDAVRAMIHSLRR